MDFKIFGNRQMPHLLLIPGLGVSCEIFLPLIQLLESRFCIIAAQMDGFTLDKPTAFTSIDDQALQVINYIQKECHGHIACAYGLSLGGKILSLLSLHSTAHVQIFPGMNHGQLLIDHPHEVAQRIVDIASACIFSGQ